MASASVCWICRPGEGRKKWILKTLSRCTIHRESSGKPSLVVTPNEHIGHIREMLKLDSNTSTQSAGALLFGSNVNEVLEEIYNWCDKQGIVDYKLSWGEGSFFARGHCEIDLKLSARSFLKLVPLAERKFYGDPLRCRGCAKEYLLSPTERVARVALLPPSTLDVPTGPDERKREEADAECPACRKKRALKLLNLYCPNLSDPDPLVTGSAMSGIGIGIGAAATATSLPSTATAIASTPTGASASSSSSSSTAAAAAAPSPPASSPTNTGLLSSPHTPHTHPVGAPIPVLGSASNPITIPATSPVASASASPQLGSTVVPKPIGITASLTAPIPTHGVPLQHMTNYPVPQPVSSAVPGMRPLPLPPGTVLGPPPTPIPIPASAIAGTALPRPHNPVNAPIPIASSVAVTSGGIMPAAAAAASSIPVRLPYQQHHPAHYPAPSPPRGIGAAPHWNPSKPPVPLVPASSLPAPLPISAGAKFHNPLEGSNGVLVGTAGIPGTTYGGYSPYPNGPPPSHVAHPSAIANPYAAAGGGGAAAAAGVAEDDPTVNTGEGVRSLFGKRFKTVSTASTPQFRPENDAFRSMPHKQSTNNYQPFLVMPTKK